ncbi:MAG TPA: hypothetical protein VGS07_06090 [Thermoanaerobaculia bacterium]|nr:hypothetical protein [Thermoanaerobaculia bacterium]
MSPQPQPKPTPQLAEANHYELHNGALNISYTARDLLGRPQLTFQDGKQTRHYVGDQIHREATALGLLLSIGDTPADFTPVDRFTLVLPTVLVVLGKAEKLSTFVVFENRAQVGHLPQPGPVETYSVKSLSGTANLIIN